ncbi:MAG: ATP-binding protein [Bacillota bacterium]|nr:ATP-binding protein [Bacillota bacterium]
MKLGTRGKLYAGFVIIAVLTISAVLLSYNNLISALTNKSVQPTVNEARVLVNPVLDIIKKNYMAVLNKQDLNTVLEIEIKKLGLKLQIVDMNGRIVYDSEDAYILSKNKIVDIETQIQYDSSFQSQNPGLQKISFPIAVNGSQIGNAVFVISSEYFSEQSYSNKAVTVLLPVIMGCSLFLIAMLIYIARVSKGILKPVSDLNKAAGYISKGKLDIRLQYRKSNEIGDFTRAFDMMREELQESLLRQAELEKERKELIASISHDIKTPVASIKAYTEGLLEGMAKDPETSKRYLDVIKRKTDSLVKLVEDLFQHSLQDLGKFRINITEGYSQKLLTGILEPLMLQFGDSKINFIIEKPIPDVLVKADPSRIEQVILNLVQNAAKYTPEGGTITLGAKLEGNFLKVEIRDTGYGISPEELPFVFDRFYRSERFKMMKFEGAGLGLSICKYIVEQHSGSISVSSSLNSGSCFTFTIPKV